MDWACVISDNSFWTKKAWTSDAARVETHKEAAAFFTIPFEFNCASQEMRTLSEARYNAQDDLLGNPISDPDSWRGVVPDTIGERLLNGACSAD